ncbi:hypothetical protein DIPPA_27563 [Diplonema papillatum]|nr:hypothetical protein DIPPA_27563 [Diplonema papillatum]
MVFTVFCAADVYGSKWNLSVEFPTNVLSKGLTYHELVDVIECAYQYECKKWKPHGEDAWEFQVEYLAIMEVDHTDDGRPIYYSGLRVTEDTVDLLEDGSQIHVHQPGVLDSSSSLPPPRNTIIWELVRLFGFSGPESQMIPSLFFKFDTRATGIVTEETMCEAFPADRAARRLIEQVFAKADPSGLGYITFGAWLEVAAEEPRLLYQVQNEWMWQKSRETDDAPPPHGEGAEGHSGSTTAVQDYNDHRIQHRQTPDIDYRINNDDETEFQPFHAERHGSSAEPREADRIQCWSSQTVRRSDGRATHCGGSTEQSHNDRFQCRQSDTEHTDDRGSLAAEVIAADADLSPYRNTQGRSRSSGLRAGSKSRKPARPCSPKPAAARNRGNPCADPVCSQTPRARGAGGKPPARHRQRPSPSPGKRHAAAGAKSAKGRGTAGGRAKLEEPVAAPRRCPLLAGGEPGPFARDPAAAVDGGDERNRDDCFPSTPTARLLAKIARRRSSSGSAPGGQSAPGTPRLFPSGSGDAAGLHFGEAFSLSDVYDTSDPFASASAAAHGPRPAQPWGSGHLQSVPEHFTPSLGADGRGLVATAAAHAFRTAPAGGAVFAEAADGQPEGPEVALGRSGAGKGSQPFREGGQHRRAPSASAPGASPVFAKSRATRARAPPPQQQQQQQHHHQQQQHRQQYQQQYQQQQRQQQQQQRQHQLQQQQPRAFGFDCRASLQAGHPRVPGHFTASLGADGRGPVAAAAEDGVFADNARGGAFGARSTRPPPEPEQQPDRDPAAAPVFADHPRACSSGGGSAVFQHPESASVGRRRAGLREPALPAADDSRAPSSPEAAPRRHRKKLRGASSGRRRSRSTGSCASGRRGASRTPRASPSPVHKAAAGSRVPADGPRNSLFRGGPPATPEPAGRGSDRPTPVAKPAPTSRPTRKAATATAAAAAYVKQRLVPAPSRSAIDLELQAQAHKRGLLLLQQQQAARVQSSRSLDDQQDSVDDGSNGYLSAASHADLAPGSWRPASSCADDGTEDASARGTSRCRLRTEGAEEAMQLTKNMNLIMTRNLQRRLKSDIANKLTAPEPTVAS